MSRTKELEKAEQTINKGLSQFTDKNIEDVVVLKEYLAEFMRHHGLKELKYGDMVFTLEEE